MRRLLVALSLLTGVFMSTHASANSLPPGPTAQEGFAFLDGAWTIENRRLKEPLSGRTEWREFTSSARFFSLLDGIVSVEELRDVDGKPFGSAMRTFDRERRVWLDAWVSAKNGVLGAPVEGKFVGDRGEWTSPMSWEGKEILVRGVWTRINPNEVHWEQAASTDAGKTWEINWHMRFLRKPDAPVAAP